MQIPISQSLEVIKPWRNRTSSPVGIKRAGLNRRAAGLTRRRNSVERLSSTGGSVKRSAAVDAPVQLVVRRRSVQSPFGRLLVT
jgi:hypothetical protein